ncbi:hypothetical protein G7046_g7944 [Stylonectria norvegica]|nr:hypothetical protein G7046_g7944 [Stylonectria norvegica]
MASPFKNILIVGAAGSIGSVVLEALLKEPSFSVTALQRSTSKSKIPSGVKIISIDESYPTEALIEAFTGQDAIINCTNSLAISDQLRFVDAAISAKVRRYLPSEYGLNNNNADARALNSVFREKGEVQDYLRSKESTGLEWTAIACGVWLKWSAAHEFYGMHIKEKKFDLWDGGEGWTSVTTEENTALGVVNTLKLKWEETKNRIVWLSDFAINQKLLLETIENITKEKFERVPVDSAQFIKQTQAAVASGDVYAVYGLVGAASNTGGYGNHLEKEGEIFNGILGLPEKNLHDVVKDALEAL